MGTFADTPGLPVQRFFSSPMFFFFVASFLLVSPTRGEFCTHEIVELREAHGKMRHEIDKLNAEKKSVDKKVDEMVKKIEELSADNRAMKEQVQKNAENFGSLETSITEASRTAAGAGPYVLTCAYKYYWRIRDDSTITYDSLIDDYKSGGGDGAMDLATGVYTLGGPSGHYTITFSGRASLDSGDELYLYLYKNGNKIKETEWVAKAYTTSGSIMMRVMGSRTVTLHLDVGDRLEIKTEGYDYWDLYNFMFCLQLTAPDA